MSNRTHTSRYLAGGLLALGLGVATLVAPPQLAVFDTATPAYAAGDVCDICGIAFDPVACERLGGWPYDSTEEEPPPAIKAASKPAPSTPAPSTPAPTTPPASSNQTQTTTSKPATSSSSSTAAAPAAEAAAEEVPEEEVVEAAAAETEKSSTSATKKTADKAATAVAASESEGLSIAGPATLGGIVLAGGGLLAWLGLRRRKSAAEIVDALD